MDRGVDEDGIRPFVAQTVGGLLATMGGTAIHDPKDTASGFIRLLAHDFGDKPVHWGDAALDFAAAEDFGAMDIPGCQVGPSAFAEILMLETCRAVSCRRQRRL